MSVQCFIPHAACEEDAWQVYIFLNAYSEKFSVANGSSLFLQRMLTDRRHNFDPALVSIRRLRQLAMAAHRFGAGKEVYGCALWHLLRCDNTPMQKVLAETRDPQILGDCTDLCILLAARSGLQLHERTTLYMRFGMEAQKYHFRYQGVYTIPEDFNMCTTLARRAFAHFEHAVVC